MGSAFRGRRDCVKVEARLNEYLTGALPEGEERTGIERHLADCPACRERAAEWSRLEEAVSAFRDAPLPERPGDWQAVRARLGEVAPESRRQTRRPARGRLVWTPRTAVTGVLAGALAVAAVAFPANRPTTDAPYASVTPPVIHAESTQIRVRPPYSPRGTKVKTADTFTSTANLMGFSTVGDGQNTLSAAPVYFGPTPGPVVPLAVEIGSDREAEAEIEIRPEVPAMAARVYRHKVRLVPGLSLVRAYPSFSPYFQDGNRTVRECMVTLSAPGRRQTLRISVSLNNTGTPAFAYIGHRFGAITPRRRPDDDVPGRQARPIPAYLMPEYAPERAVGYSGLSLVVLSPEAAAMKPAQWQAIREWVVMGGRLLLTDPRLLHIPEIAAMAPVRGGADTVEKRVPVPEGPKSYDATMTTRQWGLGAVSCIFFDPTAETFRSWPGCDFFWRGMMAGTTTQSGSVPRLVAHTRGAAIFKSPEGSSAGNPFEMSLPSVQQVLVIFLGYFVLVVPITFVVLKHTRRLNLAWLTGPLLALAFAGGVFLLTARLYFMPAARRTRGIVFAASGDTAARFAGYTELFLPRAGRYELPFPRADYLETAVFPYDENRPLQSVMQAGTDHAAADLAAGNLSFRRIHHEQSVALPGAVTVSVRSDGSGGLVGFVDNGTGRPLNNARIMWEAAKQHPSKLARAIRQMQSGSLGTVPPGRTPIRLSREAWTGYEEFNYHRIPGFEASRQMTLMAEMDGEPFGPRIGRDFSGERSVTLMIGLNTRTTGGEQ